jgi:hypothetical protein
VPGEDVLTNCGRNREKKVNIVMEGIMKKLERGSEKGEEVKHEAGVVEEAEQILDSGKGTGGL